MAVNRQSAPFDAEYAVLGSMLIDADVVPEVLSRVDPGDFAGEVNRRLFEAVRALFREGAPVDAITVVDKLGWSRDREKREYVAGLMEITPTSANCMEYAGILHEQAMLRRIRENAQLLAAAPTLEACRAPLAAMTEAFGTGRRIESWTLEELFIDFANRQSNPAPKEYISYGLAPIDAGTYTERGDIVMIGGAPSDGKTAFALSAAYHMAKTHSVGFFSLETNKDKLEDRLVASGFQIDLAAIKRNSLSGDDWERFARGSSDAAKRRLRVFRVSGATVDQITATSKAYGLDVVFIDYVQLIEPGAVRGVSRADQMAAVSRALHVFAQTSDTLVVELAQLTRQERGNTRERDMFDLGESSQFEKDADLILLLFRPNRETYFIEGRRDSGALDPDKTRVLKVAKNKEGRRGRWPLYFDGAHQSFSILAQNPHDAIRAAGKEAKARSGKGVRGQMDLAEVAEAGDEPF